MSSAKMPYHHGNLRPALIDAGLELAREGGPEAVILREVSRRAGVSHNAAYRHFADRDSLLKAVCDRCMSALARLMEARIAEVAATGDALADAWGGLRATGSAYLEFALAQPGLFRTAFAVPSGLGYLDDVEGHDEGGAGPLDLLRSRLDAVAQAGGLTAARRANAEFSAWSSVHGLAMLLIEGPLREMSPGEREAAIARLLDTVQRGL